MKILEKTKAKKAFTLVELIIVIAILSILSTILFVFFRGYFGNTRDSVRVSDISTIHKGLKGRNLKITKKNVGLLFYKLSYTFKSYFLKQKLC